MDFGRYFFFIPDSIYLIGTKQQKKTLAMSFKFIFMCLNVARYSLDIGAVLADTTV